MNIIYFSTPEFGIPSLDLLLKSSHNIIAVVTAPDKERGRGKKVSFTPVKQFALENQITVIQPEKLRDESFIEQLHNLKADLFIVVAFRILPKEIFKLPGKGSFNLHASLLPKYRGAAPIQWALINGETETGLTTFFLREKVDTGNIILQEKVEITKEDNFGTLHDKLSETGAELILKTVDLIESGNVKTCEQEEISATPAPKITKEICEIDWSQSSVKINNLIRALSPHPGAFFIKDDKLFKIYNACPELKSLKPSEIFQTKNELIIGCGSGSLKVLEIQPEGRKRMSAGEFLRGYSL